MPLTRASRPSARRTIARSRPSGCIVTAQEWDERMSRRPVRRFSPFHAEGAEDAVDMGAKLGRNFAAERAQDSVNLFEATADHARRLAAPGQAGDVRVVDRRLVRPAGRDAGGPWPEGRCAARPIGRRPRRPIRRSRSVRSFRSSTASRPTPWRSSPRPTSWATVWPVRAAAAAQPTSWPRPPPCRQATSSSTSTTASAATRV